MGAEQVGIRAVFDTNVVVSALVFRAGHLAWLRLAWRQGRYIPVVSDETAKELVRVLAYPKFGLSRSDINELLSEYLPYAEAWPGNVYSASVELRDADDVKFVDLAFAARVELLVSGDRHIHALNCELPFTVVAPQALQVNEG